MLGIGTHFRTLYWKHIKTDIIWYDEFGNLRVTAENKPNSLKIFIFTDLPVPCQMLE